MTLPEQKPIVLLVDDEATNLQVLRQILQDDYRLLYAKDGEKALELAQANPVELILLDIMMPAMTGYEVCRKLKAMPHTAAVPVIFVTALSDVMDETEGFEAGAVDYITKPVSPPIVRARVRTHLSLVDAAELRRSRLQVIQRLGQAAEYKDNETGMHVIRMSYYARQLALAAGFSEAHAEDLLNAAPMHDVGKIGIPDAILQKPGKLDAGEWQVMRSHAEIGAAIIGEHAAGLLKMARTIALTHHEKWDGSGYPNGLKGEEIAVEGRIVAIADVFDALTSERPYKRAWTVAEAIATMSGDSGKHFDPALLELFVAHLPAMLEIKAQWKESG